IGSKWRSVDYLRSLPRKRRTKRKPTVKQLEQQMKFIMALDFLGPLRLFFNLALKDNRKSGMTNFNAATSALMKIIEGQYPNLVIPYHKVQFSKGLLMNILPSVHNTPEEINITWSNIIASGASDKDTVIIILYDEVNKEFYVFET